MPTNWNNPTLAQTWADRDTAIKGRDESNAKMDYTGDSNIPTGTIRWNDATSRFEKWDGAAWVNLKTKYLINVDQVDGIDLPAAVASVLTDHDKALHDALGINAATLVGQGQAWYNDIPNNTVAPFYQAAAPTGYTQVTTQNDKVLRVVSGSGGGTGGSWPITGLTMAHSHTIAHTHDFSHTHGPGSFATTRGAQATGAEDGPDVNVPVTGSVGVTGTSAGASTSTTGGSSAGSSGGASTSTVSADGNWRPAYIDVIICTRNK